MNIEILNRCPNKRAFIENAVKFYAKELNIAKRKFDLDIIVRRFMARDHNFNGAVQRMPEGNIVMFLDANLNADKVMTVLAHEMVHVKQFVLGQYRIEEDEYGHATHYWLGKQWRARYYDQPWEIDAWSKERLLVAKLERTIHGETDFTTG